MIEKLPYKEFVRRRANGEFADCMFGLGGDEEYRHDDLDDFVRDYLEELSEGSNMAIWRPPRTIEAVCARWRDEAAVVLINTREWMESDRTAP